MSIDDVDLDYWRRFFRGEFEPKHKLRLTHEQVIDLSHHVFWDRCPICIHVVGTDVHMLLLRNDINPDFDPAILHAYGAYPARNGWFIWYESLAQFNDMLGNPNALRHLMARLGITKRFRKANK